MKVKAIILCGLMLTLAAASAAQVSVTGKKTTYKRLDPMNEYKATFTMNHPKVKAATAALSRKIEAEISYEKAFGFTIHEELRSMQWLEEADFEVRFNRSGLLCVALTIQGTGAYPDGATKSIVVDTRTGKRVLPGEVFSYLNGLVERVREKQKKEIARAIAEIKADKELDEPNPETLFENKVFLVENLKGFSISDRGVTFYYDYGFPHVIAALEPSGEYAFTWSEMKGFVRPASVLGKLTR